MWGLYSNSRIMIGVGFQLGLSITWIPKRQDKNYHQINIYLPAFEILIFI